MNIKVSVIVPVYGVEKYIERCAVSLLEQTLVDMEFVFVDDCTTDNSIQILRQVLKRYPTRSRQVQIVKHEMNLGLPSARKTGMSYVHGEFIAHCDSDDWVEKGMYEKLYKAAVSNNADFVWCDYYRNDGKSKTVVSQKIQPELMQGPVWNKLVKKELYLNNTIHFPTANKGEDGVLMTQLSYFSKKKYYLSQSLYNYYINPSSICGVVTPEACISKLEQEIENVYMKENFLIEHGCVNEYKSLLLRWKILSRKNLMPMLSDRKYYNMWKSTFPEADKPYLLSKDINIRLKIGYILVRLRLDRIFKTLAYRWS